MPRIEHYRLTAEIQVSVEEAESCRRVVTLITTGEVEGSSDGEGVKKLAERAIAAATNAAEELIAAVERTETERLK